MKTKFIAIIISMILSFMLLTANADESSVTVLPQARVLSPFTLTGTDGNAFSNKNLQGQWTLLFFGFTRCGSICPTAMVNLKKTYADIAKDKKPLPQVVLVSIDPENDTIPVLKKYVTSFNPDFKGATGSKQQLDKLASEVGVLYLKNQDQIDHSGTILLIDPHGALKAVFSMPHDPQQIAQDYEKIIS